MNTKDQRYFYFATIYDKLVLGIEEHKETFDILEEAENFEACKGMKDALNDIEEGMYNDFQEYIKAIQQ